MAMRRAGSARRALDRQARLYAGDRRDRARGDRRGIVERSGRQRVYLGLWQRVRWTAANPSEPGCHWRSSRRPAGVASTNGLFGTRCHTAIMRV